MPGSPRVTEKRQLSSAPDPPCSRPLKNPGLIVVDEEHDASL